MTDINFIDFFERIKKVTPIKKQVQLAKELGVGRAAISIAKQKNSVPLKWVLDISEKYKLDPFYLITGRGRPFFEEKDRAKKIFLKPVEGEQNVSLSIELCLNFIHPDETKEEYLYLEAIDNSMEPTISQGDVLIIDTEGTPSPGCLFVFKWIDGNEILIRRISIGENGLILVADNVTHPHIRLNENKFKSIGKVIGFFRKI